MSSTRVSSDFLACWAGVSRSTTSSSANISSVTAFWRACHAESAAFVFSSSWTFHCSTSLFLRSSSSFSFSFSSRARFRRKDRAAESTVSLGVANEGSSPNGDGGIRTRSGHSGKLSISNPWLSPSVPVGLRPAPSTPSPASEYDTRNGGAFLREPAAPLCARAAATHASGALCRAEPHQRRVRHGWGLRHAQNVRGVSWSELATVPKRKSRRSLDLSISWNFEEDIWKVWKKNNGTERKRRRVKRTTTTQRTNGHA